MSIIRDLIKILIFTIITHEKPYNYIYLVNNFNQSLTFSPINAAGKKSL